MKKNKKIEKRYEEFVEYFDALKEYYFNLLNSLAERSTCNRAKIASIIIKDKIIVSTGYNGAPRKLNHCDKHGHIMINGHCIRTVHAEENAIINAARLGISIENCKMISLYKPCFNCMKKLINSGIVECYYFNDYYDKFQIEFEKNSFCRFIKL